MLVVRHQPSIAAALLAAVLSGAGWCCPLSAMGEEYGAVRAPALQASRVTPAPLPTGAVPARSHYTAGGNAPVALNSNEPIAPNYAPAHRAGQFVEPAMHEAPAQLNPIAPQPIALTPRGSTTNKALLRTPASGWGALTNVGASLGFVLAAFLCVAWLSKRYLPKAAGPLPKEVVEQLGWAPLAGRQQMHLVRIGNKLVLLAITPGSSAEALSEVTEPTEVERLSSICRRTKQGSSTQAFRQVINELERQPARGFVDTDPRPARPTTSPSSATQSAARPQPGRPLHG
ncbi:Flagellar biosynthesis protein, FliO [Anatilimnocola aggregata]|uniref:Flagellar biosynthesis protein, FliO n=1 Tax=Anatilimnocola aggregata TaxID=2528021 RepID=A0A517YG22_9BACT|nr:flagellar biosynthetic protein FliO [Anatilimnocola aggregata]QDU29151.1 Flagellar biosynthesis protein, FliO [Anatilimnocola aggregata]